MFAGQFGARSTQENERLWAEEAERHYQEWLENPAQARDAETVFADIRASLVSSMITNT